MNTTCVSKNILCITWHSNWTENKAFETFESTTSDKLMIDTNNARVSLALTSVAATLGQGSIGNNIAGFPVTSTANTDKQSHVWSGS